MEAKVVVIRFRLLSIEEQRNDAKGNGARAFVDLVVNGVSILGAQVKVYNNAIHVEMPGASKKKRDGSSSWFHHVRLSDELAPVVREVVLTRYQREQEEANPRRERREVGV